MSREDIIRKLTSRKFWLAVASFVALVVVACGATEEAATQITALIMAGATVLGYILGEGLVDAARIGGEQYDFVDESAEEDDQ